MREERDDTQALGLEDTALPYYLAELGLHQGLLSRASHDDGMVDNQKFINKLYALYEKSLSSTAFPKIVFDRTRIPGGKWTNQVGVAIGANGDVNSIATTISGAQMSARRAKLHQLDH